MTSYIYFIQANGNGPIKIGTTQFNPLRRMVKIQSDCPWPVRLLGAIEGSVAQEKQIHQALSYFRTQGEWFEPHSKVLSAIEAAVECGRPAGFDTTVSDLHGCHPLKAYRKTQNPRLSQGDLAKALGVTRATVNRWENGRRPSVADAERLSEMTSISVVALLRLEAVQ